MILMLAILNFAIKSVGGLQHFWATHTPREPKAVVNVSPDEEGNPFPISSPAHREFLEFRDWIMHNRKLQVASNAGGVDRRKLFGQLTSKGMARLPTDLLEGYMPFIEKVVGSLDNTACGNLVTGEMNLAGLTPYTYQVIASLDKADAKKLFLIEKAAIDAQLDNLPIIPVSTADAGAGVIKIAESLSPDEAKSFLVSVENLRSESAEKTCETVRTIFSHGSSLPEPYRGAIARMLVSGRKPSGLTRRYEDLPPKE
ncbi:MULTISPECIES: hypothetical protein [Paraburkholderia]|uniref:Uncharacterized protein n=2 Tax=Paraburkholderia TaxID=1822464 RepID=A0A7Y9WU15_9BURK|nr:hypothetical protein [Paraburkholderia bryophila]NYH26325.1 hypothetical protein [Paraburkholderia bryophila]